MHDCHRSHHRGEFKEHTHFSRSARSSETTYLFRYIYLYSLISSLRPSSLSLPPHSFLILPPSPSPSLSLPLSPILSLPPSLSLLPLPPSSRPYKGHSVPSLQSLCPSWLPYVHHQGKSSHRQCRPQAERKEHPVIPWTSKEGHVARREGRHVARRPCSKEGRKGM